jgi:hypothetical protein
MMVLLVVHLSSPELRIAASEERLIERLVVAGSGLSASKRQSSKSGRFAIDPIAVVSPQSKIFKIGPAQVAVSSGCCPELVRRSRRHVT